MKRTLWHRSKFWLNGFLLIAPAWFLYQSLNPQFPSEWPEQAVGPFTAAPMPLNNEPPYPHDGIHVKDFSVRFCEGCVAQFRTAHLAVAEAPPNLEEVDGILHGSSTGQHVHAPYPQKVSANDKLWLSIQTWDGQTYHTAWSLKSN